MENKRLDKEIRDHLEKETEHVTKLKDKTWENIQGELFPSKTVKSRKRVGRRFAAIISMAAAIAIVWAGLTTTTGQALIQNLKDMFVEEKDVELDIEGQKESTHVELEANEELRYVIYVDQSRYKLVEGETSDKIITDPPLEDSYPEVSMEITRKEGTDKEEVIQAIKQEIADLDMDITAEEVVDTPLHATKISAIGKGYTNEHGKTGTQWDTPVHRYYVTDDESGQFFVIKSVYFLEAAEGHGARFHSMLESFEIVN